MAIYVTDTLKVTTLHHSDGNRNDRSEFLIVDIAVSNCTKVLLAVVYRPPHTGYLSDFFNAFLDLSVNYKHSIVFGDFNTDLGSRSFDSEQILSFVDASHLFLVPYSTIRATPQRSLTCV